MFPSRGRVRIGGLSNLGAILNGDKIEVERDGVSGYITWPSFGLVSSFDFITSLAPTFNAAASGYSWLYEGANNGLLTLPEAAVAGWCAEYVWYGEYTLAWALEGGGVIKNAYSSEDRIGLRYEGVLVACVRNTDGDNPEYLIRGTTGVAPP